MGGGQATRNPAGLQERLGGGAAFGELEHLVMDFTSRNVIGKNDDPTKQE